LAITCHVLALCCVWRFLRGQETHAESEGAAAPGNRPLYVGTRRSPPEQRLSPVVGQRMMACPRAPSRKCCSVPCRMVDTERYNSLVAWITQSGSCEILESAVVAGRIPTM
jgi:hypothetical protein